MKICKEEEKLKEFKSIAMNILKPKANKELINEGCFLPNCMQRTWEIKKQRAFEQKTNELPQHTKVLMRKEVKFYTVINFFAEVGGYHTWPERILRSKSNE